MKVGQYKTPTGKILNVVDFDEANEMAYVHIQSGQHKWYPKSDYINWESTNTAVVPKTEPIVEKIPEVVKQEEVIEVKEPVKPKKKNAKADKK